MMYLSVNGKMYLRKDVSLPLENRAFRYGDGIFETIRMDQGSVLWKELHYQRMIKGARLLQLELPGFFTADYFYSIIDELYCLNHPGRGSARVRFSLSRSEGGYYTPASNRIFYVIETEPLPDALYKLNKQGLKIGIYPMQRKPMDLLSPAKTSSALLYVMASIYKKNHGLDDCLIMNADGNIAEACSSNIFICKEDVWMTPGLDQACVEGVMRSVLIAIAREHGIKIMEGPVDEALLLSADEVFLCNAVAGIQWVGSFGKRTYGQDLTNDFFRLLLQAAETWHH